jgi:hypothetical protein
LGETLSACPERRLEGMLWLNGGPASAWVRINISRITRLFHNTKSRMLHCMKISYYENHNAILWNKVYNTLKYNKIEKVIY